MKDFNKLLMFLSSKNIQLGTMTTGKCTGPNDSYETLYTFTDSKGIVVIKIRSIIVDEFGNSYFDNVKIKVKGQRLVVGDKIYGIDIFDFIKSTLERFGR